MLLENKLKPGQRVYIQEEFFTSLPDNARHGKVISYEDADWSGLSCLVLWDDGTERRINSYYLNEEYYGQ
jgi:hypothetical protein